MKNCKRIGLLIGLMSCFLVFGCKDDLTQKMPDLKKSQNVSNSEKGLREGYVLISASGSASMTPPKPKSVTRLAKDPNVSFYTKISEENQDYLIDWTKLSNVSSPNMGIRLAIAVVEKKTKKVAHVEYVYIYDPEIKRKTDNLTGDDIERDGYYMYFPGKNSLGSMPSMYLNDNYEYYASGYLYRYTDSSFSGLFGTIFVKDENGDFIEDPNDPSQTGYRTRYGYIGTPIDRSDLNLGDLITYRRFERFKYFSTPKFENNKFVTKVIPVKSYPVTSTWTKIERGSNNHFDFNLFLKPRGTMLRFNVKNNLYSTVSLAGVKVKTDAFVPDVEFSQNIPVGENIANYEGHEISWKMVAPGDDLFLKEKNGLYEFTLWGEGTPAFGYDYYKAKGLPYDENNKRNTSGYMYAWVMPSDAPGRLDSGLGKSSGSKTIKVKPLVFPTKNQPIIGDISNFYRANNFYLKVIPSIIYTFYEDAYLPVDELILKNTSSTSNMWIKEAFNYSLSLKPVESDLMITQLLQADRSTKSFVTQTFPDIKDYIKTEYAITNGFNGKWSSNTDESAIKFSTQYTRGSGNPVNYSFDELKKSFKDGLNLTMVTIYNPTNKPINLKNYGLVRAWYDVSSKRNKFFNGRNKSDGGGGDNINDAIIQNLYVDSNTQPVVRVNGSQVSNRNGKNRHRFLYGTQGRGHMLQPGQSVVLLAGAYVPAGRVPDLEMTYIGSNNANSTRVVNIVKNGLSYDKELKYNIDNYNCLYTLAVDNGEVDDEIQHNTVVDRLFSDYNGTKYFQYIEGKNMARNPDAFDYIVNQVHFQKSGVLQLRDMQGLVLMKKDNTSYKPLDACLVDLTLDDSELNKLNDNAGGGTVLTKIARFYYRTAGGDYKNLDGALAAIYRHPAIIFPNLAPFRTANVMNYSKSDFKKYLLNDPYKAEFPFTITEGDAYVYWISPAPSGRMSSYPEDISLDLSPFYYDNWLGSRDGKRFESEWMKVLKDVIE